METKGPLEIKKIRENLSVQGVKSIIALIENGDVTSLDLNSSLKSKDTLNTCWGDLVKAISMSTIKKCNLSYNNIGTERVGILAQALHNNSTLTDLELSHNNMNNEGLRYIVEMLNQNTTIASLNLMQNGITDKYYAQLLEALQLNGNVVHLSLQESSCPSLNSTVRKEELKKILAQNKKVSQSIKSVKETKTTNEKSSNTTNNTTVPIPNENTVATIYELTISNEQKKKQLEELEDIKLENISLKLKVNELEKKVNQLELEYQNANNILIDTNKALELEQIIKLKKDDFTSIKSESPLIDGYINQRSKRTGRALSKIGSYYVLGKGGFSDIVLVEWQQQLVAMKRVRKEVNEEKVKKIHQLFLAEASLLIKLRAPNIIYCYAVSTTSLNMYMLVELMECDLYSLLQHKNNTGNLDIDPSWNTDGKRFAHQIVSGLCYLHSRGVIHKDLKSANCLIKDKTVKITDFGISIIHDPMGDMVSHELTVEISSPEMLSKKPVSFSTDIFSLGIILWELYHWEPAWPKRDRELEKVIIDGKIAEVHSCNDKQMSQLLQNCWNISPEDRPSIEIVCENLRNITSK